MKVSMFISFNFKLISGRGRIHNIIGRFEWGNHDFTGRANDIRFNAEEGGSHVPVLRAQLMDDSGRNLNADVNLCRTNQ
jgi:hypothetical protein